MKKYFEETVRLIDIELESFSIDTCDISTDVSFKLVEFLHEKLNDLRDKFIDYKFTSQEDEICFFKEMKPLILSRLLYFNKIYTIELKRPNGSNISQKSYYEHELDSLTFFFNRNLDFYQYYRSCSTHLDECYFLRGKPNIRLCVDSSQFISDPLFSTGYDYKVAKILSNEMLRIYLNKRLQEIDKLTGYTSINKSSAKYRNKWTAPKAAAIELGYALYAAGVFNNGSIDIRDIMMGLQNLLNIDLGDYYRTYVAIKNRKKERTAFLKHLAL